MLHDNIRIYFTDVNRHVSYRKLNFVPSVLHHGNGLRKKRIHRHFDAITISLNIQVKFRNYSQLRHAAI